MAKEIDLWIPPTEKEDNGTLRRSGQTTRLIDEAIQVLFKRGIVEIYDHSRLKEENEYIGHKTMFRLQSEHGHFANEHVEVTIKPDGAYIIYLVKDKEPEEDGI